MPFIDRCAGCPYADADDRAVGTRGNPTSAVVLVGEAPGAKEVVEGRPFFGPAGDELRRALAAVTRSEDDVFVVNAVACRPHPRITPSVRAIEACCRRMSRELERAPRAVIVTLGRTAYRAVTGCHDFKMLEVRGKRVESAWGPVLPTLHPARVLRMHAERDLLAHDLRAAFEIARRTT